MSCCLSFHRSLGSLFFYMFFCCHLPAVNCLILVLTDSDNSAPVSHLLSTHLPSHISAFTPIITRDFKPPKPSPAGILHIAKQWGVASPAREPSSSPSPLPLIMVGDSIDDIIAGYEAGALTVLVRSEGKEELEVDSRTDVVVGRLDELVGLLEGGIEARAK